MTLRNAMGWIALGFGGLMITVLVWGIFSPTLPTGVTLWPFLVVAAGIGIKYIFGANKTGLFIYLVGVILVLAYTVFGLEQYLPGNTNVVAEGQPSPPNRRDQTPETWGAWIARWNGPEMANQGLPSLVSMAIFSLAIATVLYGIFAVAWKGGGNWPQRIGGFTVFLALIYLVAVGLWGTERVHGAIQHIANETPLPGSIAAEGAGDARTSSGPRTPPALNANAVTMPWTRATTLAFHALPRDQGCIRWSIDASSFEAFQAHLQASNRTNAERQFLWEARGGGVGPKPGEQLQEWARSRSPTVFIWTLPC
jgi:hypothetical protein